MSEARPDRSDSVARAASDDAAARIEASHDLAHVWPRAVVELTFEAAGRPIRIDTEGELPETPDDAVTVHGTLGEGTFAIEMSGALLAALTGGLPDAPDLGSLAPGDAALVLEHAMTGGIEAVEADLGETIRIETIEDGPLVTELEPFAVAVWAEKRRHVARAVIGDALHMRILTEWLRGHDMADEFDAGTATRVEIGPIVLAAEDWAEIEPGDALSIGTEAGQNLRGRLVRPSGRSVPVEIDTSHVIVQGPVREPRAADGAPGEIALGVAIGTVRLTPTHLARAARGGRFIMERNEGNACALLAGDAVVARGVLTLIDDRLGVEVHSIGAGSAPDGTPGPDPADRPIASVIGTAGEDADEDADDADDADGIPFARAG